MKTSIRKRLFAWVMSKGESINRKLYGPFKRDLFVKLSGTVVEIGPGTGINFNYFPSSITWLGLEPNEAFHKMLLSQASEKGIRATLLPGDAENIPLGDNSADAVICTLVLCSVRNPDSAIGEMKRVLKRKTILNEHVAAPKEPTSCGAKCVNPPRVVADGVIATGNLGDYSAGRVFPGGTFEQPVEGNTESSFTPHYGICG
jgi:SAM-dependent methyltransferase